MNKFKWQTFHGCEIVHFVLRWRYSLVSKLFKNIELEFCVSYKKLSEHEKKPTWFFKVKINNWIGFVFYILEDLHRNNGITKMALEQKYQESLCPKLPNTATNINTCCNISTAVKLHFDSQWYTRISQFCYEEPKLY